MERYEQTARQVQALSQRLIIIASKLMGLETVFVAGGSTGVGKEIAKCLAARGSTIASKG